MGPRFGILGLLLLASVHCTESLGGTDAGQDTASDVGGGGRDSASMDVPLVPPDDSAVSPRPDVAPRACGRVLSPGVWTEITPPEVHLPDGTFGCALCEIDPNDPCTIVTACDGRGAFRSTDGGGTWQVLTRYFGSPHIRIDPRNSRHMYASAGVGGDHLGFWVSVDGGATWLQRTLPAPANNDVGEYAIDPTNFDHVLVQNHSPWTGHSGSGVLETMDGGLTWTVRLPVASWGPGTFGINFLYDPAHGVGNRSTWLAVTDGNGSWRTSDGGVTWTQVNTWGGGHGAARVYYATTGVLYAGGYQYPTRSMDNGLTWEQLNMGPAYSYYYDVVDDGTTLYTGPSFPLNSGDSNTPYFVSPVGDGVHWTPYRGGAQRFRVGPYRLEMDRVNRVIYSANFSGGLWALRLP
jgi:hypothetical protein